MRHKRSSGSFLQRHVLLVEKTSQKSDSYAIYLGCDKTTGMPSKVLKISRAGFDKEIQAIDNPELRIVSDRLSLPEQRVLQRANNAVGVSAVFHASVRYSFSFCV
jgi:hypothetical protein